MQRAGIPPPPTRDSRDLLHERGRPWGQPDQRPGGKAEEDGHLGQTTQKGLDHLGLLLFLTQSHGQGECSLTDLPGALQSVYLRLPAPVGRVPGRPLEQLPGWLIVGHGPVEAEIAVLVDEFARALLA